MRNTRSRKSVVERYEDALRFSCVVEDSNVQRAAKNVADSYYVVTFFGKRPRNRFPEILVKKYPH